QAIVMGRDKRPWRKLVKKLRRSKIRTANAKAFKELEESQSQYQCSRDRDTDAAADEAEAGAATAFEAEKRKLDEELWKEREERAQGIFRMKQDFLAAQKEKEVHTINK